MSSRKVSAHDYDDDDDYDDYDDDDEYDEYDDHPGRAPKVSGSLWWRVACHARAAKKRALNSPLPRTP